MPALGGNLCSDSLIVFCVNKEQYIQGIWRSTEDSAFTPHSQWRSTHHKSNKDNNPSIHSPEHISHHPDHTCSPHQLHHVSTRPCLPPCTATVPHQDTSRGDQVKLYQTHGVLFFSGSKLCPGVPEKLAETKHRRPYWPGCPNFYSQPSLHTSWSTLSRTQA